MLLESLITKTCTQLSVIPTPLPYLTNTLEFLIFTIITSQQEGAISTSTLTLSVVSANRYKIQRITQIFQVILLQLRITQDTHTHLQPVQGTAGRLIRGIVHQRLHHQTFTAAVYRLHQELLHLFCIVQLGWTAGNILTSILVANCIRPSTSWMVDRRSARRSSKGFCSRDSPFSNSISNMKMTTLILISSSFTSYISLCLTRTTLRARVLNTWKGKIFLFSRSQATHSLSNIQVSTPAGIHYLEELMTAYFMECFNEVRIFGCVIFAVAAEDLDTAVRQLVNLLVHPPFKSYLCAFAIILVLTGKLVTLEAIQHFRNAFGRFGQHGLYGNTWCEMTVLMDLFEWMLE